MDAETFQSMLKALGKEIRKEINKDMATNLQAQTETLTELIKKETTDLRNRLNAVEDRVAALERGIRRRNIIIHGMDEMLPIWELADQVREIVNNQLEEELTSDQIDNVYRLGKPKEGSDRPVLVALTTQLKKIQILKNKSKLAGTHIKIYEDVV